METTLDRYLTGVDVPPFSYTAIAHTHKNSPFNEYPYAMARLRWFTDSFYPTPEKLKALESILLDISGRNGHFRFLQVSDAGRIDVVLNEIYLEITGGETREARDRGTHEPGLGRWQPDDEFIECHAIRLPVGADRQKLFDRVRDRLESRNTDELAFDEVYLYPPRYGQTPDEPVEHYFRIFGHAETVDRATAFLHLHEAVETVLSHTVADLPAFD